MQRADARTRRRLLDEGALFDGYRPKMEEVHLRNAERLSEIVDVHGWPGRSRVGEEAAEAAFLVAAHAISRPRLLRRFLAAVEEAVGQGEAPARYAAHLGDLIRFHEGRPQRFGLIFDWDRHGELGPGPIEDPSSVDERRRAVGLGPLAAAVARARREAERAAEAVPHDFAARERQRREWACRVGWR